MTSAETAMIELSEKKREGIVTALELIRSTKRRSDLSVAVYDALTKNDIIQATQIANNFPQKTTEDQEAV